MVVRGDCRTDAQANHASEDRIAGIVAGAGWRSGCDQGPGNTEAQQGLLDEWKHKTHSSGGVAAGSVRPIAFPQAERSDPPASQQKILQVQGRGHSKPWRRVGSL